MSIIDKITGRTKKAAGDIAGDRSLRAEGRREERKGEEKDKLADAQDRVEEKAAGCGRPRAPHLIATRTPRFELRTGARTAPVCRSGGVP